MLRGGGLKGHSSPVEKKILRKSCKYRLTLLVLTFFSILSLKNCKNSVAFGGCIPGSPYIYATTFILGPPCMSGLELPVLPALAG